MTFTLQNLKAHLREGEYAWPGGYVKFFIADDGGALSFEAVKANLREVMRSTMRGDRDGWRIDGVAVNWEDESLVCSHTGKLIPSAYGED